MHLRPLTIAWIVLFLAQSAHAYHHLFDISDLAHNCDHHNTSSFDIASAHEHHHTTSCPTCQNISGKDKELFTSKRAQKDVHDKSIPTRSQYCEFRQIELGTQSLRGPPS